MTFLLAGCGSSGGGDSTTTDSSTSDDDTNGSTATAVSITLSADPIAVKSDNSDSSTIIATVLDASNAVIEGITVAFSAGGGQISASSVDTDATGQAQITLSSGTSDPSNQVITITGTVSGLSSQVPVQITGSTLTLSTDNSNITDDGSTTAALTVTANDAGGTPVYNIPVTLSVSGSGGATLSAYTDNTDINGEIQVTVTGTGVGSVTVTATGLGTTGTQTYTVSLVGALFGITSPTTDPYPLSTNTNLPITVNAPALANVQFATTLGTLTGGGETGQVIEVAVAGGTASAVFSSSQAGLATIQVFDPTNSSTSDTLGVTITAPAMDAARITLQSSTYVVSPSSGGISNTATLTATVRTSDLQVVGSAPVAFSIENPTGGGETVSPVVVYTNGSGIATTTFTSGSLPSVAPVIVSAWVVGEGTTGPLTNILSFNNLNPDTITRSDGGSFVTDGFEAGEQIRVQGSASNDGIYIIETVVAGALILNAGETLAAKAAAPGVTVTITAVSTALDPGITIGGTAGSVVIGRGSEITVLNATTYALPMSVLVADSNSNAVSGAVVTLSAWPAQYSAGTWYDEDPEPDTEKFVPYISGTFDNEDLNENTFLDPGEDTNGDDLLTPPNSAAGTLPATVTTGENGVANFDLVYLKDHANWIRDRIRASTFVLGTETTSSITFRLSYALEEGEAGDLNDSPYPVGLTVTAGLSTTPYTFPVFTNSVTDTFTPIYGAITGQRTYTYTEPGTGSVNDVITDWITIIGSAIDPETGASSPIGTIVPVQIIVK